MAANTDTINPQDRTECPGCWEDDCAVCTDASTWKGHGSQTHGQLTYAKNLASDKQVTFLASLGMAPEEAAKLTKTEASAEIDKRLKAAPPRPMSDKQESYLRSLLAQKNPTADADGVVATINGAPEPRSTASAMIDALRAVPTPEVERGDTRPGEPIPDGFYVMGHDDERKIVKVQRAHHGSGNLYAKALDPETGFDYWQGGYRQLCKAVDAGDARPLTLDEAKDMGKLYGICCCCGATLTDETSIANGIGPVCAKRL